MTERSRAALERSARRISIGPSRATWSEDGDLVIEIDELGVPLPRRVRGHIRVSPIVRGAPIALDRHERHHWHPIAPRARVAVHLDRPEQSWTGHGYLDHNRGCEPLEAAFLNWSWSRTIEEKRTRIYYDTVGTSGERGALHLSFEDDGAPTTISAPPLVGAGHSLWRLPIEIRSEPFSRPPIRARWEDGPFYARTLITPLLDGKEVLAVHETLSLRRFTAPLVQAMLPFRMPRRTR